MKIALDMQSRQTAGSRERGIGRYSLSLAQAMLRKGNGHDFSILLNGVFDQTLGLAKSDFDLDWNDPRFKVYQTLSNSTSWHAGDAWRQKSSEYLRESFIASQRFDFVHCTSLFESPMDDSSTSWGQVENTAAHAVTLYDLIPYVFPETYLTEAAMRISYLRKIQELRKADLLLAISDYSRSEAVLKLGIDPERIVNIAGAADERFRPITVRPDVGAALLRRHGLKKFIMYTGGIDHRKNIERLIKAYSGLPRAMIDDFQLVIVCTVRPHQRDTLMALAAAEGLAPDRLVMTGYVSDDDLVIFYNLCELFVFPSWCEGFGLPALEAMQCGAPVIAASTSSLPEVVGLPDALFDPYSIEDITAKIKITLEESDLRRQLRDHGLSQAKKFTWENSAAIALAAMEESHARNRSSSQVQVSMGSGRPSLAFVSPLPPSKSGIAGYSAQLLPFLEKHYRITLICKSGQVADDYLDANFSVRTPEWLLENAGSFDRVLYHFGNSDHHDYMFRLLESVPGTVVLHDFWMSNVLEYIQIYQNDPHIWDQHLHFSHGWPALCRRKGQILDIPLVNEFPCNRRVIESAVGVIVHSRYSANLTAQWYGDEMLSDVHLVNSLKGMVQNVDKAAAKQKLGFDPSVPLICSFGFIHSTKHSLRLAQAFLRSELYLHGETRLVLAGQNADGEYGAEIARLVSQSRGRVSFTGFVSDADYALYLEAADAAVQLRAVSRGETSAAALDCLANSVALVINDNGAFSQIPDEAVIKLPSEFEDDLLVKVLDGLFSDESRLKRLREAGEAYLKRECEPAAVAAGYRDAIERSYAFTPLSLRSGLAERLISIDLPISPTNDDLEAAAGVMTANFPNNATTRHLYVDESLLPVIGPAGETLLREWLVTGETEARTELFRIEQWQYVNATDSAGRLLEVQAFHLPPSSFDPHSGDVYLLGPSALYAASTEAHSPAAGLDKFLGDVNRSGARLWWYWPSMGVDIKEHGFRYVSSQLERVLPHVFGIIVDHETSASLVDDHLVLGRTGSATNTPGIYYPAPAFAAKVGLGAVRELIEQGGGEAWQKYETPHTEVQAWPAAGGALLTENGMLLDGFFLTQAKEGFLVYGPYAALQPGEYTLKILGAYEEGSDLGSARFEVVADKGQNVLCEGVLDERSYCLADRAFSVEEPLKGVEIRIWTGIADQVAFRGYYLSRHVR